MLEGLEVAFIVLTFGVQAGRFGPSVAGALAAFVLVALVGVVVHRPLTRVPENAIKFAVGIALTTFGTFWAGEGIGVEWPAGDADAADPGGRSTPCSRPASSPGCARLKGTHAATIRRGIGVNWLIAFGRFWYDFIVGDSASVAIGGVAALALTALLVAAGDGVYGPRLLPLLVALTLAISLRWPR